MYVWLQVHKNNWSESFCSNVMLPREFLTSSQLCDVLLRKVYKSLCFANLMEFSILLLLLPNNPLSTSIGSTEMVIGFSIPEECNISWRSKLTRDLIRLTAYNRSFKHIWSHTNLTRVSNVVITLSCGEVSWFVYSVTFSKCPRNFVTNNEVLHVATATSIKRSLLLTIVHLTNHPKAIQSE